MQKNKNLWIALIVVAIIAVAGVFTPVGQSVMNRLGGVTNYDEVDATAIKVGGSNGSRVGPIIFGTCSNLIGNNSVTASTTKAFDCAVTGVVSGDTVVAIAASTTPSGYLGMYIAGVSASTTSGFITIKVANPNAAAAVPYEIASSSQYLIFHPVTSVPGF